MPAKHDPYACFKYPNYRVFVAGNFLAEIGQQMLAVAVQWEIYQRTNSTFALGLIGFISWLPIFLFILPAGSLADRSNRKHIVLITQLVFAVCSFALALNSYFLQSVPAMYIILFLMGITIAISDPAKQSIVPRLLPAKDLPNALTWNSTIFQTAMMLGPALGGFLIAWIGFPLVYTIDGLCAVSFFCFAWNLIYVHNDNGPKRTAVTLESLSAGLKFVWNTKIILATITMDLFVVILGGAVAVLPAFAKDILHSGPIALGWLRAAPAIGAFLMATLSAHMPPMKKVGQALLWAVAGFGVATVVFGLSHWFWLSFAMLFLTGALDNISVIVRSTLVQVLTPDSMRGRVNSVSFIFIHSSNYLGAFESGTAAALMGLVPSVVFGGVGSVLVVLAVLFIWPEIARLGTLADPLNRQKKA